MKKAAIYFLFLINFFTILFFWWSHSGPLIFQGNALTLISLGRLSGLLAALFVLTQFMLIGRAIWLERTFGLDKLSRVHALNGKIAITFILFHPILLTLGYSFTAKKNVVAQFLLFFTTYPDVWLAVVGLTLFCITVGLSIQIVRKHLKYETWYYVHLFNYLAIYLALGHQLKNGEDFLVNNTFVWYWWGLYIFVFGHHLIFRFLRPLYLTHKHQFTVHKVVKETEEVTSVYIKGRRLDEFHVKPGQFMIHRFFDKKRWWQAHPFSMSMYPDGKNLRLSIKNLGDFTSQIPQITPGTKMMIDGPFGIFTSDVTKRDKILLIAGGIGITPIRSLLEQFVKESKDVILIFNNKEKKLITFEDEIERLRKKYAFKVYHVLSQEKIPGYETGRIDTEKIQRLVKDFKKREIFLCGPPALVANTRKILHELGVSPNAIHFELFSL